MYKMVKRQMVNAVIFHSKYSNESKKCINKINEFELPIKFVTLDDSKSRKLAKSGKSIQVHNVPSLLIEFEAGDIQLFTGSVKIMKWINDFVGVNINTTNETTKIDVDSSMYQDDKKVTFNEVDQIEYIEDGDIEDTKYNEKSEVSTNGFLMNNTATKPKSNVHKMAEEMKRSRDNIIKNNTRVPNQTS